MDEAKWGPHCLDRFANHEYAQLPYFTGAPNENIVQNHLNMALLNVF